MSKWEYQPTDPEDYLRELGRMARFWAEKVAKIPQEDLSHVGDIPKKILGRLGVLHVFLEEAYIYNRIELSEDAGKLDETEKLLRQQIDRDIRRIREALRQFSP